MVTSYSGLLAYRELDGAIIAPSCEFKIIDLPFEVGRFWSPLSDVAYRLPETRDACPKFLPAAMLRPLNGARG